LDDRAIALRDSAIARLDCVIQRLRDCIAGFSDRPMQFAIANHPVQSLSHAIAQSVNAGAAVS
jgi:hypothetical protein